VPDRRADAPKFRRCLRVSDNGVSRFGPQAKRGDGFRPLFIGLANLNGSLRFRSGDHALIIDGRKLDVIAAKTAQKVHLQGFLISVACRLRPES
jgi:hypothetical protein